ncbi:MAG TPA: phosphatidylglycerophosphatase A [Acetobacteraceae bacterium]|nr:phosphatidylglycerophosphatase A [Acetobacteraceae bacterium]
MGAARLIAAAGGLGHVPRAPGTAASAAAVIVGWVLLRQSPTLLGAAIAIAILFGFWSLSRLPEAEADPGWVVIDEVAGQFLALLGLVGGAGGPGVLAAFLLFRLFDIAKPGPVGWADRRGGATGVMLDDLIAGLLAAALLAAGRALLATASA